MRTVWRFFVGGDARWRWQVLSTDKNVVSESSSSYAKYDACLAAAQASGYVFEASQPGTPRPARTRM
jgi:hypothetical protein